MGERIEWSTVEILAELKPEEREWYERGSRRNRELLSRLSASRRTARVLTDMVSKAGEVLERAKVPGDEGLAYQVGYLVRQRDRLRARLDAAKPSVPKGRRKAKAR